MDINNISDLADLFDILVKTTLLIGGFWGLYKFVRYRELKQRIQLEIDANIFRLSSPEDAEIINWDRDGNKLILPKQPCTHAIEILLKFTNKGFTRIRLYNIQIGINSMRPRNEAKFDQNDGHLHLSRILTSGNIVPIFNVKGIPVEETSFYYIEPNIEQTIQYLVLTTEPRELIQIQAKFSFEQKRIFPSKEVGEKGLFPHTAARTFQINS